MNSRVFVLGLLLAVLTGSALCQELEPRAFWIAPVKTNRPGFWASFDATYYWGGRTTVSTGLSVDFGGDRATFAVAYQFTWNGQ